MIRLGAIFVAVCIVLIAGSLGVAAYLYLGLSIPEASILAVAAMAVLALCNVGAGRLRDRREFSSQIADLSRSSGDLAREVAEMGERLTAIEAKVEETAKNRPDPLAAELGELGALVQQLAETLARHDTAIRNGAALQPPASAAPPPAPAPVPAVIAVEPPKPVAAAAPVDNHADEAEARAKAENAAMIESLRDAIEDGRIDLYLQPIVTLPQRKVRYYEALSRMRGETGNVIMAADFLEYAEAGGLMGRIDNLTLFRSVQVVRRLTMKNRDIGLFCNIAGSTLSDAECFPQLVDFADANRALASSLVFEFTQRTVRDLGPVEEASLAAFAERGFRFSMDHVADLRFDPRELAERGFRFVKVPASLLLSHASSGGTDIHPADLADLLSRHGIELIASMVESEGSVVDLLDFEVRYGQGFLFSPPRPVRQEALRGVPERGGGIPERSEGVARGQPVRNDRPAERAGGKPRGGLGQLARSAVGSA